MKTKDKEKDIMCRLLRDHEDMVGSSRATMLAMQAFVESIKELKCDPGEFQPLYSELSAAIKTTEPKMIPLIHLIEDFEREMASHFSNDSESVKKKAIELLLKQHDRIKKRVGKVIEQGIGFVEEDDVIIVHTASTDVINMLLMAREVFQKKFKMIVLKQDFTKTKRLINAFSGAQSDLLIIPEYNLSHHIPSAKKMFIGGTAITYDLKVVAPLGTSNVASMCHVNDLPVYLFANTLKISHKPSTHQDIHLKEEAQAHDNCEYVLTTHSHDMMDMGLVDFLVTEEGCFEKDKIKAYILNHQKSSD